MTSAGARGESAVRRLADFELDQLAELFPAWTVTRMGTMLRADRPGFKSRFTESAAVMAAILADANFVNCLNETTVSGPRRATGQ